MTLRCPNCVAYGLGGRNGAVLIGCRPSRCWMCNRWRVRTKAWQRNALVAAHPEEAAQLWASLGTAVYDELLLVWREEQEAMSA